MPSPRSTSPRPLRKPSKNVRELLGLMCAVQHWFCIFVTPILWHLTEQEAVWWRFLKEEDSSESSSFTVKRSRGRFFIQLI